MPALPLIKTASWATKLPDDHLRVGISRGTPRRLPAGYRVFRSLAPGPWFNSVGIEESSAFIEPRSSGVSTPGSSPTRWLASPAAGFRFCFAMKPP